MITLVAASFCLSLTLAADMETCDGAACHSSPEVEANGTMNLLQTGRAAKVAIHPSVFQLNEEEREVDEAARLSEVVEEGEKISKESRIFLAEAPLLTGNLEEQAEFCTAHPAKAWDKERMKASVEIVRTITKALRKSGIPPMVMEGTLLSFFRQGFLVNGDADLDFWIPRQFMRTPNQWNSLVRSMADQGIHCESYFEQYAAGWKLWCAPQGKTAKEGWKLNDNDPVGFYLDLSIVDKGTGECLDSPAACSEDPPLWTNYLTVAKKTYPGFFGPYNWRLASWHNVTLWVPSDPAASLAQLYTAKWKQPVGGAGHYTFWQQNGAIPQEEKLSYFKNEVDLNAATVLKFQDRLEQANAKQIAEDAQKQWTLAVDFCGAKKEEYMATAGPADAKIKTKPF